MKDVSAVIFVRLQPLHFRLTSHAHTYNQQVKAERVNALIADKVFAFIFSFGYVVRTIAQVIL